MREGVTNQIEIWCYAGGALSFTFPAVSVLVNLRQVCDLCYPINEKHKHSRVFGNKNRTRCTCTSELRVTLSLTGAGQEVFMN